MPRIVILGIQALLLRLFLDHHVGIIMMATVVMAMTFADDDAYADIAVAVTPMTTTVVMIVVVGIPIVVAMHVPTMMAMPVAVVIHVAHVTAVVDLHDDGFASAHSRFSDRRGIGACADGCQRKRACCCQKNASHNLLLQLVGG
jgi:hypothetical protein